MSLSDTFVALYVLGLANKVPKESWLSLVSNAESYASIRSKFKKLLTKKQEEFKEKSGEEPSAETVYRILQDAVAKLPPKTADIPNSLIEAKEKISTHTFPNPYVSSLYKTHVQPAKSPKKKAYTAGKIGTSTVTSQLTSSSNIKELIAIIHRYNEKCNPTTTTE